MVEANPPIEWFDNKTDFQDLLNNLAELASPSRSREFQQPWRDELEGQVQSFSRTADEYKRVVGKGGLIKPAHEDAETYQEHAEAQRNIIEGDSLKKLLESGLVKPSLITSKIDQELGVEQQQAPADLDEALEEFSNYKEGVLNQVEIASIEAVMSQFYTYYLEAFPDVTESSLAGFSQELGRILAYQIYKDKSVFSGSDHGKHHIIDGNIAHGLNLLNSLETVLDRSVSAKDRVIFMIAAIMHDIGYTEEIAQAPQSWDASKDHPIFSTLFLDQKKEYFMERLGGGEAGEKAFRVLRDSVLMHSYPNMEADFEDYDQELDIHPELIQYALAIVDALGVTAEIKASEAFRIPAVIHELQKIRSYKEYLERDQDLTDEDKKTKLDRFVDNKKMKILAIINEQVDISEERKAQYENAVKNFFNQVTVDFTLPQLAGSLEKVELTRNSNDRIIPRIEMSVSAIQTILADLIGEEDSLKAFMKAMGDLGMGRDDHERLVELVQEYRSAENGAERIKLAEKLQISTDKALFAFTVESESDNAKIEIWRDLQAENMRRQADELITEIVGDLEKKLDQQQRSKLLSLLGAIFSDNEYSSDNDFAGKYSQLASNLVEGSSDTDIELLNFFAEAIDEQRKKYFYS